MARESRRRTITKTRLFELGQLSATPAALERAREHQINILELLSRHAKGDWGDLDEEDKNANDHAVRYGERVLSSYGKGEEKLWIITERDRSVTTVLCPGDY